MKTHTKITRDETVFNCDYCLRVVPFYTRECFGCGKGTCNDSCNYEHMVEYQGGRPAELSSMAQRFGTGVYLPTIYFCKKCNATDLIAKQLKGLDKLNMVIEEAYSNYRRAHHKLADKAHRAIEKRESEKHDRITKENL